MFGVTLNNDSHRLSYIPACQFVIVCLVNHSHSSLSNLLDNLMVRYCLSDHRCIPDFDTLPDYFFMSASQLTIRVINSSS
jgi:hypothetical protein